jgi:hypothetical protein
MPVAIRTASSMSTRDAVLLGNGIETLTRAEQGDRVLESCAAAGEDRLPDASCRVDEQRASGVSEQRRRYLLAAHVRTRYPY